MNVKNIQECAKFYETLMGKNYIFTLENDIKFTLFFKASNFYHLIGLHKLKDIRQLVDGSLSLNKIYKNLLSGELSSAVIEKSAFYHKISSRIEHFEKILEMLDKNKSKIIIDFDPELVEGTELLNTKYILYKHLGSGYANLTLGENKDSIYPETFFTENSKRYISEQILLDVIDIEIVENHKKKK